MNTDLFTNLSFIISTITIIFSLFSLFREVPVNKLIQAISKGTFKNSFFYVVPLLIDLSFIVLWISLQLIIYFFVVDELYVFGFDRWMLIAFQILFAISTLIPIIIYIYVDVRSMRLRQLNSKEKNEPNQDINSRNS